MRDLGLEPQRTTPLWLLASLTLSGTLAMHIFVPALPYAAADFRASSGAVQATLSAYIAGLALGQLIYGPLSDRFGRRPVLIWGMLAFAASSFAAMLAATLEGLILLRLLQALGGCTGLVLGRAIVRDEAAGAAATRRLSLMNLMVMIGPGLSPLLGSALSASVGWRSIFAALCLLGAVNLVLTWRVLRETRRGGGGDTATVLRHYRRLAISPRFLGFAVGGGCATTSIYAFVGAAPFIFVDQLHRPPHEVGFFLALNIAGAWFGALTVTRVAGRFPLRMLLVGGSLLSCAASGAFLAGVVSGHLSIALTLGCMVLFTYGAGIASPAALTAALGVDPRVAGSASGLYGFIQMSIGAGCTVVGGLGGNAALMAATVMLLAGGVAQVSFLIAGDPGRR